ncbi:2-oxo-4-hydroxy-4-carboxy-5-ureidoimidazoline decarboxylase [Arthrobacter sp. zg-Y877]|uniref:2-oxo-4-hydroxy-4-carboxy-5-ureidoimidazoline decarboxylase n=1 Tax=Arthrobacter sp. zg-Y877 TaxID=3049074 RepID=UPI0025A405EA|nr:2-oxo-4-hydroxy-4-carboxy-5-ureidoimidazoline decarboxylase [Arthrobacter sp. zg-Y877]MDM7991379.1 2-oxo-4-hydroxy-4-carboxy-5-ureidoimidazoline decarboxylase [Arthrobacter sp. zg-Y877]
MPFEDVPTDAPDFLTAFNTASRRDAEAMLRPCADIPRWYNEVAAARPFTTAGELLSFAELAAPDFTEAEIDAALAHHPHPGDQSAGTETQLPPREEAAAQLRDTAILRLEGLLDA